MKDHNTRVMIFLMTDSALYSARTVRTVCGVSARTLDYWVQTELVTPTRVKEHTHDEKVTRIIYLFDFEALVGIKTIAQFRQAGVSLQEIRRVVADMQQEAGADWKSAWLVTDGSKIFRANGTAVLEELGKRAGQMAFAVVALGDIRDEVEGQIKGERRFALEGSDSLREFSRRPTRAASRSA